MTVEIQNEVIVGEIEIEASPAAVFDALTDTAQLQSWWGSEDTYRTRNWQSDLRPGGRWSSEAINQTGRVSTVSGVYLVIDRPRELAYTWNPSWAPGEESEVRFVLEEFASGTLVRVTHSRFKTDQSREAHSSGWQRVLGWLGGYFSKKGDRI